jgi:UDP-glucose 4-epimerase
MLVWTIGAGGLIGSAVVRASQQPFAGPSVPWSDPEAAFAALRSGLDAFAGQVADGPWALVWAAGSATVSASDEQAAAEAALFHRCAQAVADSALPDCGVVLVVSSAGGIHAGSPHPPFSENTPPAPISAYGRARLAQEQAATEALAGRWPVVLARLSNVYGPGQDLAKLQGLVSRLAVCSLTREPLNLFVPLSTVRDYVYVHDAAAAIHAWIHASAGSVPGARVRIIASGQGTSIGQLVRTAQDVGHRRVPIAMGSHPSARSQAPDLRFVPSPLPDDAAVPLTPLPVGMKRVFDDVRWRLQAAIA